MNLDLKHLCRSEATARLTSVDINHTYRLCFETSDGFRFEVPLGELTGCVITTEPVKAITYMKWIKRALAY